MTAGLPTVPPGYRLLVLDEVGSTNAEAAARAADGDAAPLWVVGRRQTAGRGRQGRPWTSEIGNLYASLMLRDPVAPERYGEFPLVVAVAVHDAVSDVLPPNVRGPLEIKWPNDVLYDGAKLCGILIEGSAGPAGRVVVIGIGINCAHHPADAGYAATDLATLGYRTDPDDLFPCLAHRLDARLRQWRERPFAEIREAWIARARGIGGSIRVRLPQTTLHGRFEALDAAGRLLLRLDDGRLETISAGDVFFGRDPAS